MQCQPAGAIYIYVGCVVCGCVAAGCYWMPPASPLPGQNSRQVQSIFWHETKKVRPGGMNACPLTPGRVVGDVRGAPMQGSTDCNNDCNPSPGGNCPVVCAGGRQCDALVAHRFSTLPHSAHRPYSAACVRACATLPTLCAPLRGEAPRWKACAPPWEWGRLVGPGCGDGTLELGPPTSSSLWKRGAHVY